MEEDLFGFNSPLGSFSARIKLAFYLGKLSKVARRELDLIRDIRNKFAHDPNVVAFADQNVANQCRELKFSFRERADEPRAHFLGAVFRVLAHIHAETFTARAPDVKADD